MVNKNFGWIVVVNRSTILDSIPIDTAYKKEKSFALLFLSKSEPDINKLIKQQG